MAKTLPREYFDNIYRLSADPWNFESSEYERDKYRDTLDTLNSAPYRSAVEIGCSIGVQTAMLAKRCQQLVAIDTSSLAIARAQERCAGISNIEFKEMSVPQAYPDGVFDLTVLSEVGYYFTREDLLTLAARITEHSFSKSQLLLVHWLLFAPDHPLTGDQVHELFLGQPRWVGIRSVRRGQYRIDLLERAPNGH